MRVVIDNKQSTATWVAGMNTRSKALPLAAQVAGELTARETQQLGRADIAAAGRFGNAWQSAFTSSARKTKDGIVVTSTMSGRHWRMFQEGRVVHGRPLLWIPFSDSDAKGLPMGKYPGELVRVESRAGLPLMISTSDHRPKYFGKASVTIPKKFHLIEIAHQVGSTIDQKFTAAYQGLTRNG